MKDYIHKHTVKQRFSKAKSSYEEHAIAQQQICLYLAEKIDLFFPDSVQSVFEIGCGSGILTQKLIQQIHPKTYIANDLYAEVMDLQPEHPSLSFCIGDIEMIDIPKPIDAIVSSSALQWIHDLRHVLTKVYDALQPYGLFAFSIFGEKNLHQIKTLTGQGLTYFSMDWLCNELENLGFDLLFAEEQELNLNFAHPLDVLKHLQATGVTASTQKFVWTKQKLNQFYQDYQFFSQNNNSEITYPLTYHPIYIVARRLK